MKTLQPLILILWMTLIGTASLKSQIIIAHRGCSGEYPENTMLSFEEAVRQNVEYIELDVRMSQDDSIMVIHDETLDRTTNGEGAVKSFTYAGLKEYDASYTEKFGSSFKNVKIPSLYEVLSHFKGKVKFVIEAKNVSEIQIINIVTKLHLEQDVIISSYNQNKISRISENYPNIKTAFIANLAGPSSIEICHNTGADVLITSPYISKRTYDYAIENKLEVWFGIINSMQQIPGFVKDLDCGIISDYPKLIRESLYVPFVVFSDKGIFYVLPEDMSLEYDLTIFDLSGKMLLQEEKLKGLYSSPLHSTANYYIFIVETKEGIYSFKEFLQYLK